MLSSASEKSGKLSVVNGFFAFFLLASAILCDPYFIRAVCEKRTQFNLSLVLLIWVVRLLLLGAAVYFFIRRKSIRLKNYLFGIWTIFVIFLFVVLCDFVLGLLAFPSEYHPPVAYPPYYREVKQSIGEYAYEFQANSLGLRYREIPSSKQDPDERRILVLGDSFTEGRGVEYNQTFCALLESAYADHNPPISFINAGLGGIGPQTYLQVFYQLGLELDIDAVIIAFFANDTGDVTAYPAYEPKVKPYQRPDGISGLLHGIFPHIFTMIEQINDQEGRFLLRRRNLVKETSQKARELGISEDKIQKWSASLAPEFLKAANRLELNGALLSKGLLRPEYWITSLDVESPSDWQRWVNTSKILSTMNEECREREIQFAVVYIPDAVQYSPAHYGEDNILKRYGVEVREKWLTEETRIQQLLKEWAGSQQVPFLDLTDPFRKAYDQYGTSLYYKSDTHWTPLGHKVAAEHIKKWIEASNLFDLNSTDNLK